MTPNKKTKTVSIEPRRDWTFMKTKYGEEEKFLWDEILYLEAEGDYTTIFTTRGSYLKTCRIGELAKKLNHPTMVRCHKSFAVNTNKIESLKPDSIVIKGVKINVSKKLRHSFFQEMRDGINI